MGTIDGTFGLADQCDTRHTPPQDRTPEALQNVGSSERTMSAQDYAHERAIAAAGLESEMHMRLRQDALDRYRDTSCLLDQADADRHLMEANAAAELQRALILARSPERVAQMVAAQSARMAMEPGA